MTDRELYTKGAKVWVPHAESVWEGASVEDDYLGSFLHLQTDGGFKKKLVINSDADLPPLRNPSILIGENDLTTLSYLHEPAVLYNLKYRFCENKAIYTYCGIVLVAVNPYAELSLYGPDSIMAYRSHSLGDLEPHIFAVAEEAYTKLEREKKNQSIIVSGESGAGKTVSAKYAMRYFASVGGSDTETQVERKVLASSPIMEAIGNAKTTRNDNSSRFGKFTELLFNQHLHITGASMRTYLLEKSRVIFQAPGEQSYHIFYQLCSARDELPHLLLGHQDTFNYLNQGRLNSDIEQLSDLPSFVEFCTALSILGFSKHEQDDMFKVWAAILHLGNITFVQKINEDNQEKDTDSSDVLMSDLHLSAFCSLLDIDPVQMRNWLCKRQIVSMHEHILKPMSIDHSENARDALAKHMYAKMFDWVVKIINKSLDCPGKSTQFIGVLDIYGFETFDTNSFEQFCINYANEKLQQQFNRHVFKLEQEEYLKEGIEWTMIDFYDNQPCIDLIESKLGILNLLDEECTMPKGSDSSWAEKLYSKCVKYKHFVKPRFGSSAFSINHFADLVQYESFGFLEKNRDTVLEEQIGVLRRSNNRLVCKLFEEENTTLKVPGVKMKISAQKPVVQAKIKQHKQSVGSQFRDSLSLLMTTLDATTPYYVRCIKPNDFKEPFSWNPSRAVQQLRACGVLETIRISAAGFPSRWNYSDFFARYRVLCKSDDINRKDMMTTCHKILSERITAADKFQFGKTIIFFRAGQVAYLEKLRAEQLRRCCIIMQSQIRAYIQRQKYLRLQRTANGLQRHIRGLLARRKAILLRQIHAATTIQRYARGYINRRNYKMLRRTVLGLQRYGRGLIARRHYRNMLYNYKAIIIQKNVRGWLARLQYQKIRQQIIICQSAVRRFLARRRYKKLKAEARSVEHVKKLNKGLENKIISLQQKIQEHNKVTTILKCAQNEVIELKSKLEQMRALENQVKKLKALLHDSNNSVAILQERIKIDEDEKMLLVVQQQNVMIMLEEERKKFNIENESLRHELQALSVNSKSKEKDNEVNMQIRLDEARDLLDRESEQEKAAYQRLLQDYNALESRAEEMQEQLAMLSRTTHPSKHVRSLSDVSNTSDALPIPDSFQVTAAAETQNDVSLLLKLQQKLHIVEVERTRLARRNEELEKDTPVEDVSRVEDRFRLTELEMENAKLKQDLQLLRQSVFENSGKGIEQKELMEQFRTLQEELDRRRDECIQLRSVLSNQSSNLRSFGLNYSANDVDIVNEDGELVQAFEGLKKINRKLETELQKEKTRFKDHENEWRIEVENLRSDNERQQKLLSGNLGTSENQTEAYMQYEITRLTSENLDLQELNDTTTETCRKYKKQLRLLQKRLKEAGLSDALETLSIAEKSGYPGDTSGIGATQSQLPAVRKKDREVQGMFEYKKTDEPVIIKRLVYDLKPRVAVTLLPCLPAYILFMCIRHTDLLNDDIKVRTILGSFINAVKKVIKKRSDNLELAVLWLANMLRLLHNLKQYSGDKAFQKNNTLRQNEQCLRNFDLSEYRQVTSDIAVWIYQCIIRHLEERIQPLIVPAILEHEAITGLLGHKPAGMRGRSSSVSDGSKPLQNAPAQLVSELTSFLKTLGFYGVDPELIVQIFKQLFYFICASSLNNLLLRKDLCHWSKGTQIRYNLSHLESWTRDQKLEENTILATLQPIIQAAHLLQARKTEEDIQSVCEMCPKLTAQQICKILNLYTPADEYESRVSISFIRKLQTKLEERASQSESECQNTLLMDSKVNFPVRFPFNPSGIRLEDIEIPEIINLPMLIKI